METKINAGIEKKFRDRNVLITGGLGFIGSNLAHALVKLNANVTIIDSLVPEYGGNLFNVHDIKDKVVVNIADVRDPNSMDYLVRNQNYIFNLAGQVSHLDSMKNPFPDLEINTRSQLILLEACRRNNMDTKVVFAGSRSEYGRAEYLPVDEKHPINPTDLNGVNKWAGGQYHIVFNNAYGLKTSVLRLTNTFGPRQMMKNDRQTFLAWFIKLAIDNETIKIFGDGKQLRDFNYITDVTHALLLAMALDKTNGQTYNLGSCKPISVIDTAKKVVEIAGSGKIEKVPFPEEKKKIEVGDHYADYAKIKKDLGWEPKTGFEEGLKKTIEYFKKHKAHYW